jgi:hypothetical protein
MMVKKDMTSEKHKKFSIMDKKIIENLLKTKPSQKQKDTFVARMQEATEKLRQPTLEQAFTAGILTQGEYNRDYKDRFYDDFGCDSFIQYLNTAMNAHVDKFVTSNMRLVKSREMLQQKFKLDILTMEEAVKIAENDQN